jgi:hypothetical protein
MKELQGALSVLKRESDSGSLYTTRVAPPAPPAAARAAAATSAIAGKKPSPAMMMIGAAAVAVVLIGGGGTWWFVHQRAVQRAAEIAAQTPPPEAAPETVPEPPPPPPDTTLTNDSVMQMVEAKVSTDLILSQIRSAEKTNFDLSTQELIRLTKAGVTPLVIEQMRDPKRVVAAPARARSTPSATKQKKAPEPAPAPVVVAAPAPTPAPVPIAASPAATLPPTPAPAAAVVPQTTNVAVPDGVPFTITLTSDIPADAEVGRPIRFTAAADFRVKGLLVVPKGAAVYGEISEAAKKKVFGFGGSKLSFKLTKAETVGGHQINVRVLAARSSGGVTQRAVETNQRPENKDLAAAQGAQYIAYIDGDQVVMVPQK